MTELTSKTRRAADDPDGALPPGLEQFSMQALLSNPAFDMLLDDIERDLAHRADGKSIEGLLHPSLHTALLYIDNGKPTVPKPPPTRVCTDAGMSQELEEVFAYLDRERGSRRQQELQLQQSKVRRSTSPNFMTGFAPK